MLVHRIPGFLVVALCAAPALAGTVVVSKGGPISTIQGGVDAAGAGDTVKVKTGVYQENVTIGVAKTGLRLIADGEVLIDARPAGGAPNGSGIQVDADDVSISGIVVENAQDGGGHPTASGIRVTGDGFSAQRCIARGCAPAGFEVSVADDASFKKCSAVGGTDGFVLENVSGARFKKCSVRAAAGNGMAVTDCSNLVLKGFRCVGTNSEGFQMRNGTCSGIAIVKSRFELCRSTAINCGSSPVTDIEITNCTILTSDSGMSIGPSADARILGNRIEFLSEDGNGLSLFEFDGARVENNRVRGAIISPFRFSDGTGLVVRGNQVRDSTVTSDAAFSSDVTGGRFESNRVSGGVGPGFEIEGDDCDFFDNVVSNSLLDGFFVRDTAAGTLLDGNVVRNSAAEGLDHRGANSIIRNNAFTKCRLDLTNEGTATFKNNKFKTGGAAVPHEID